MRKLATGNLYDFDCTETTARELQRRYIDVCLNYPAYYSKVCLVNLREAGSANDLERQDCALGTSIYEGVCLREAARCQGRKLATRGAQDRGSYRNLQTGSVDLKIAEVAGWRVVNRHG